ncbi:hypothetical protein MOV08_20610 [Streptomyces yunnanensis]|uniref:Uncharacterized protein n=1 Tax=Streptomyces yunnanensis TaxID=156453 RepID=A0A9X8MRQ9_9ACTN|nr:MULTISPECIES: hypothetical protein [Streptomyces]WEB41430.1 hypothetical protein MOV08_20610 [Streptomyces yunnanensis]SHL56983.1 hypothetical protein SAMN05216268_10590 [Streptomyces yunnanensis]
MADSNEPDDGAKDEAQTALCDLCGTVISDGTEWYAVVPDSSSIHAVDAKFDGKRVVVGCTKEHLAELVEQYEHRPFVQSELWAGKIARAVEKHRGRISKEVLAGETGLTPEQIAEGVAWENLDYLRWRQQFGDDGPEPTW